MHHDADHRDADRHADRGQRGGQPEHRAQGAPPGGQAALRDDHDQRAEAERTGQLDVVEPDAQTGLADGHARAPGRPGGWARRAGSRAAPRPTATSSTAAPTSSAMSSPAVIAPARAAALTRPIRRAAGAARRAARRRALDQEELVPAGRAGPQRDRRRPDAERVGQGAAGRLGGPAVHRRARSPRRPGPGRAGRRTGRRPGPARRRASPVRRPTVDGVVRRVGTGSTLSCGRGVGEQRRWRGRAARPHGVKPSSTASADRQRLAGPAAQVRDSRGGGSAAGRRPPCTSSASRATRAASPRLDRLRVRRRRAGCVRRAAWPAGRHHRRRPVPRRHGRPGGPRCGVLRRE